MSRQLLLALATLLAAVGLVAAPSPSATAAETYSAPLSTAIADLPVEAEDDAGYDRDLFPHWSDADDDGCSTRDEVLIEEADDPVEVGSGCSLSGGRWYSYYDGVSWTDTSDIDIDHMVPLKEAWGSGAKSWSTAEREAYANDLDDRRTLVGVTDSVNQAKSDQDIAEWLPEQQVCRYLGEFVAVKHRWGLSVDSAEQAAMESVYADEGCADATITVTLAR